MNIALVPARRATSQDDMREALQIRMVANELRDTFKNRTLPGPAQWLLSGVVTDLIREAERLMEARNA